MIHAGESAPRPGDCENPGDERDRSRFDDATRGAYNALIHLLARREHSRLELQRKLAARGHPPEVLERALAVLVAKGLQSDQRFAENYVRSAMDRGQGVLKIRAGLRERGIDDELAAAFLDQDDAHWRCQAAMAVAKRFGEAPPGDRAEWARRARFLTSRGFSSDVTASVLGALDDLG